jgi:predicted Zn-dependent peptidase
MVYKYKTDSGLTVLLEPVESVVSISAGLWVKTGSRNELEHQYGYAHFIEHMLFKGTKKRSARQIAQDVDRVGGQHNASTNREYTCYYINAISGFLENSVEILADMYYNSLFDHVEIDKEKNVIIEEIRMYEDTPDEYIHDQFIEYMLEGHPLSHSILGTIDGMHAADRDTVTEFYKQNYGLENCIFVISGSFSEADARAYVEKYFSKRKKNAGRKKTVTPNLPVRRMLSHTKRNLEQAHFCMGLDGIQRDDEDRWPLFALSTILGGSMSSRLFQNVRENEGICYSIYSFHSSFSDAGIFGIYCAASPDKFTRAVELIIKECRDILRNGVSAEELADSKTFMKGNLALSLESVEVRMGQIAKNEIIYGKYFSFDDIMAKINNISLDDFNRVCDRIFNNKTMSIVSVGSLKEKEIKKCDLGLYK